MYKLMPVIRLYLHLIVRQHVESADNGTRPHPYPMRCGTNDVFVNVFVNIIFTIFPK